MTQLLMRCEKYWVDSVLTPAATIPVAISADAMMGIIPGCGNRMDRDENAAINICREGLRISGIILEKSEKAS